MNKYDRNILKGYKLSILRKCKMANEHHIWCNYFMMPAKGCKMCKGLRKKYPEGNQTPDELVKKHFPDVIAIPLPI